MNPHYQIPSENNPVTVADGLSAVYTAAKQARTVIPIRETVAIVHCRPSECIVEFCMKTDVLAEPSLLAMCQPDPLALTDVVPTFTVCMAGFPRDTLLWSRSAAAEDAFAAQLYAGNSAADAAAIVGITEDVAREILRRFGLKDPNPKRFAPARLSAIAARVEAGTAIAKVMEEFGVQYHDVYVAIAWAGNPSIFDHVFGARLPSGDRHWLIVRAMKGCHYQVKTVAKILGLSPNQVTYVLARAKIHAALHPFWSLPQQRAIAVNSAIRSSPKLAKRYRCTDAEIRKVQERQDTVRLGTKHWNRKYPIGNPDAFRPDSNGRFSPDAAYYLGLMMSDGCIPDKYHIRYKCAVKDRELPVQFGNFLGTTSPVTETIQKLNGRLFGLVYRDVFSVDLIRCLTTECGFVIGAKIPQQDDIRIPTSLATSIEFLRGYYDGNGWVVQLANGTPVIGVISALRPVREAISCILTAHFPKLELKWRQHQASDPEKKGFTIEVLELSGWNACDLSALLYLDAGGDTKAPSLSRKATAAKNHRAWALSRDRRARNAEIEPSLETKMVPERDAICDLTVRLAEDEEIDEVQSEDDCWTKKSRVNRGNPTR